MKKLSINFSSAILSIAYILFLSSNVFAQGSGSHISSEAQHPLRHRAERVITDPYATNTGITVQAQLDNIADGLVTTFTETDPFSLKTAGTDNVKDTHIDWGTGATQVNPADFVNQDIGDITITTGDWAIEDDSHAHTGSTLSGSPTFTNVIATDTVTGSVVDITNSLKIDNLTGLLKSTSGVVSTATSGTDYQAPLTTGNLTATAPISLDQTRQVIGGAAVISHATTAGNIHLPTGGSSNQILKNSGSSGTGTWGTVTENAGVLEAVTSITASGTVTGSVVSLEGGTYDTYLSAGTPTETVYYKLPPTNGVTGQVVTLQDNASTIWQTPTSGGGSGDMTKVVYDAANVVEQLTGLTATQTLTNKTLTSPKINENVVLTTTATKLNYLTTATGTTGTATEKIVFDTSPTLVTPALGVATATSVNASGTVTGAVVDLQYLEYSSGGAVTVRDDLTSNNANSINLLVNGASVGTSGVGVLAIKKGTIPSTSPADETQLYSEGVTFLATGGTLTTSGGDNIHTFTSSGDFIVSGSGNVQVLIVAGGGGGGAGIGGESGGGGAGGYRYNASLAVTQQTYSIVVGGGGAGGVTSTTYDGGDSGTASSALGLSSAGGGGGGGYGSAGVDGGSGGGAGNATHGTGNTPVTDPSQGNDGGHQNGTNDAGGGGGGAATVGANAPNTTQGGAGGTGTHSSINGTDTGRAGGGGGSVFSGTGGSAEDGGGAGGTVTDGSNATANTGGGGGGSTKITGTVTGGTGGSGIVIIRYTPTLTELKVRDSGGNVTTVSPHNFKNMPKEVVEKAKKDSDNLAWTYHSEVDKKEITVDMFNAIKDLEAVTGKKYIYTKIEPAQIIEPKPARYFAQIKDYIVQKVIVADDKEWCETNLGGTWVETFMNMDKKNYAGKGFIYYPDKDNFSSPQPYPSWKLDNECKWQAPIPMPKDGKIYIWDESKKEWIIRIW